MIFCNTYSVWQFWCTFKYLITTKIIIITTSWLSGCWIHEEYHQAFLVDLNFKRTPTANSNIQNWKMTARRILIWTSGQIHSHTQKCFKINKASFWYQDASLTKLNGGWKFQKIIMVEAGSGVFLVPWPMKRQLHLHQLEWKQIVHCKNRRK